MIKDLLKYGNDLELSGLVYANDLDTRVVMFPNELRFKPDHIEFTTENEFKELLDQTDHLNVIGIDKVILRKSQRQFEQNISWNVFRRDNYTCRYCNNNKVPLTVDHIVLWEHMGASVEGNLITACRKCNKTRGNTLYPEWLRSPYYVKTLKNGFGLSGYIAADNLNTAAWTIAQEQPLRISKRNR